MDASGFPIISNLIKEFADQKTKNSRTAVYVMLMQATDFIMIVQKTPAYYTAGTHQATAKETFRDSWEFWEQHRVILIQQTANA